VTTYNGTLSFTAKPATVTAYNKSKTYGDVNPGLSATVTGTVNGDMLNYTLATTAGQYSNVGSYPITVTLGSNLNYNVTPTNGTLAVTAKAATVTADNKSKTYGDANPGLSATVSGTVNGDTLDYTLATTAGQYSSVGTYPITVNLGSNPNYSVTPTNGTLIVTPRPATVTAENKSKTYGDVNPGLTATVTGTVNGDTLTYSLATTATQYSNVGSYPITVSSGPNPNYSVTTYNGTLTINPKPATVTANNKTKTYGDVNPALSATVTGTVNGDMLNYTLATTAGQYSNVGSYPITVTLGSNLNYNVTPTNGTLTVTAKAATVTADNKSKTYGDVNPTLTATVTGTVNGDLLNYSLATTATQYSSVGTYPITVTVGSNPNYNVTKTDGTLTIGKKTATVTAENKSRQYSDPNPALTATVAGTVNGDTLNYSLATTATVSSGVGTYPITVTVGTNANYSVTKTDGTLSIFQEDANATYTGPMLAFAASTTATSVTVPLRATIQDFADGNPGNILTAKVAFVNRDSNNAVLCNATLALIDLSDSTVATATCNATIQLSNQSSQSLNLGIQVGPANGTPNTTSGDGNYIRNNSADDAILTVSLPLTSQFITGGGYLVLSSSTAGIKAGDVGTKNNFGFNVKYNKSGTNLQGRVNTIIRRTESGVLRLFQVKVNNLGTLGVQYWNNSTNTWGAAPGGTCTYNATLTCPIKASFTGSANLQDVTNPFNIISLGGNATLQLDMIDYGEPGSTGPGPDKFALTVWNSSNQLWYSSSWNGTVSNLQLLDGGNLVAH
ncbi:MAG: MBG domain-containing protein, partial [Gaiellaceae bacterium]